MNPLEAEIVRALESGEADAEIATRLSCSLARVRVVAGKYGAAAGPADGVRRRESRSYHVTAVLDADESRRQLAALPESIDVVDCKGVPIRLKMGWRPG